MISEVRDIISPTNNITYTVTVNPEDESDILLYKMIGKMFSNQKINVQLGEQNDSTVVVKNGDSKIAESPVKEIGKSILYTNSDQYKTQRNQMEELKFPEAILSLEDKTFNLKGYPKSYNEKLILIAISRYIEQLSYKHGGIHHATFQNISRINDEKGTKQVYEELNEKVDELHIYGILDKKPDLDFIPTYHFGSSNVYKYSWIVIHLSENYSAALAAIEDKNKSNEWDAIWTFNREKVIKLENKMKEYF